ncbi:MAG: hypothetical protein H6822_27000 [Planctomycetaceae bacterium]|nr:hypothetical protein [Planctomycetales bacterium]MCB9925828.1 hypothetical protein [Planctomycetaceae bacterium]
MTIAKTMVLATLALATLAFTAISAHADTCNHIDALAVRMQAQSRELISEFGQHYRYKTGYAHLRSDALQLYRVAVHIHSVAHVQGSVHHLRSDLNQADQLFHHMESVLRQNDQSFVGHKHGAAYHVFELMQELEATLHHLQTDITALDNAAHHTGRHDGGGHYTPGHGHSNSAAAPNNTAYGYRWGNSGVSFSGRGWTFRIGN